MVARKLQPTSVRFRVTALATAVVGLVLVVAALALVFVQRSQLTANLDATLVQRADDLEAVLEGSGLPDGFSGRGREAFAQLVDAGGRVLVASPTLTDVPVLAAELPAHELISTRGDLVLDDDQYRVLIRRVDVPTGPAALILGASLDEVIDGVGVLAGSLAAAVPIVAGVLAGFVWFLVGRTLAPVEAIRAEVADIEESQLARRVPVPDVDDEVARLAVTMNQMLARLDQAAMRQRRFVADASHELRTPLARIRTEADVDLARPGTEHLRETVEAMRAEAVGMQRLIDDLLYLARADEGAVEVRRALVDLDDVVLREAASARDDRHVHIDTSRVSAGMVSGDPDQLARVVRNLLDNAVRHARSTVALLVDEAESGVQLLVDDDGPGIPHAQRDSVFGRFARLDVARSRADGGTGLGLAIARDILHRHGATIEVGESPAGGARFHVSFPRAS